MRVLVAEDERRLARALSVGLGAEGYAVDIAHDGTDGLWLARENGYTAIVLDLMLPGINGYRVCETLRAEKNWTPILMLTAKDGEWDQVEGLDTGADDYLTKPFSFPVLVARLRAVARRGARERPTQLVVGDLRLDPAARRAWRGDVQVDLTAREFSLLAFLARHQGDVVSKRQILDPCGTSTSRGPEHRRGLRPPPPQQDLPALRPRRHRDPARRRLPDAERRWLRTAGARRPCACVRRPRRCSWWRSPCSSGPSRSSPWCVAPCARG
jgi:two-component system OmpR family response regulator